MYLFTDGSSKKHKDGSKKFYGGSAFILTDDDFNILNKGATTSKDTTNNRMELTAFAYGMIKSKQFISRDTNVLVVSDSKHLVDGASIWLYNWIRNDWNKSDGKPASNIDIWKIILKILRAHDVLSFKWVKAHTNKTDTYSKFNDMVDKMAKDAMLVSYNEDNL